MKGQPVNETPEPQECPTPEVGSEVQIPPPSTEAGQRALFDALAASYNQANPREQHRMDEVVQMARAKMVASPQGLLRLLPFVATRAPLSRKETP